ncbi:hypothetical protein D3C85_1183430 [compost metagenome]
MVDLAFGFGVLHAGGGVVLPFLGLGDGADTVRLVGIGVVAVAGLVLGGGAEGRNGLLHFGDVLDTVLGLGREAVVGEDLHAGQGDDGSGKGLVLEHGMPPGNGSR